MFDVRRAAPLALALGCAGRAGSDVAYSKLRGDSGIEAGTDLPPQSTADTTASLPPEGETTTLEIPGFLPAVLWIPGGDPQDAKPVVVATHGAWDNPESYCPFWRRLVQNRAFVVCTRGRRINDTAFYYPDHFFVDREDAAALRSLRDRFGDRVAPGSVLYAGYSQGAIHGVPLLQMRPELHPRAVFIEGGAAWNATTAARYRAAGGERILFVCGTGGCHAGATRAADVLSRAGVQTKVLWVPSAGHDYPPAMGARVAEELDWLLAGDARWLGRP
jgi:predicted esterase